jgi:thiol-disulfide isomerase/thioredoxin
MKRMVWAALLVASVLAGCSAGKLPIKPNEHLEIGWTPRSIFKAPPYAAWFDTAYANYRPSEEYVGRLKKMTDSVRITIVYGTWCSDSKKQLPHFFRIMDTVGFPEDRITLIAVDRTMQLPPGVKKEYGITNVPTFILSFKGMEVGRIIESPRTTLEEDCSAWLSPFFP